jgi:cholest-4-en-3-one 26-monooxygenase
MTETTSATEIDLCDPDTFVHGFPHDWFAHLRRRRPVFHHPDPNGPGFWVVTKHADVVKVSRDTKTYTSRDGIILEEWRNGYEASHSESSTAEGAAVRSRVLSRMDPPEHTKHRLILSRGFTPREIRRVEPFARDLAARLLDEALVKRDLDFVSDVAARLPLEVICELVGVPVEDRAFILDQAERLVGFADPEYGFPPDAPLTGIAEITAYGLRLAAERRARPVDDITTELVHAEVEGVALSDRDFGALFMQIVVAGHETTRHALTGGIQALAERPDQYERLRAEPDLVLGAVEEVLRWSSPLIYIGRTVAVDTELRGQLLRRGDRVALYWPSANRDADVFDDPESFDITRHPNPHVTFNGGGVHLCLGAALARLELRVFLEELVRRAPVLTPLGPPEHLRSILNAGVKHYPLRMERQQDVVPAG